MTTLREHLSRLGRKGGQATAKKLTKEQRSDSARRAAAARWAKLEKTVSSITEGTKDLVKLNRANTRKRKKAEKV